MAKKRSPVHPFTTLEAAITRASTLHQREGEHFVPIDAVAELFGLSPKASGFLQTVASVKQYGLIEEKGSKSDREFKITDLGLDVLLHPEDSQEHRDALQTAALHPALHKELWEYYDGRVPFEGASLRTYLVRTRPGSTFAQNQADAFIDRYRASLAYAGLIDSDGNPTCSEGDTSNNGNDDLKAPKKRVQVGSFVQWTSQGQDRFSPPRKVLGIADGGDYAYVEGTQAGIPMSELSVVDPPVDATPEAPPANPFYEPPADPSPSGPELRFPLPGKNELVLRLKKPVSEADFDRITQLLELSKESLVGEDDDE